MKSYLALTLLSLSLATSLRADTLTSSNALVTGNGTQFNSGGYTFSTANDLILGKQPYMETHGLYSDNTYNPGWTGQGGAQGQYSQNNPADDPTGNADHLAYLTDGSFGGNVPSQGGFASAGPQGAGYTAFYNLGSNSNGYDLTDIKVLSGWQDGGRFQQAYTIKYSLFNNPTNFITLTTVSPYGDPSSGNSGAATILTPTTGTVLASEVRDVEIQFDTVANGWSGYREVVIDGVASPEPSSYVLFGIGAAGLAFILRRRSQANS